MGISQKIPLRHIQADVILCTAVLKACRNAGAAEAALQVSLGGTFFLT